MASKNKIKFIATTKDKLSGIDLVPGQLIFSQDERVIYLDTDQRIPYISIIVVVDEDTRRNLKSPVEGFYYVRETAIIWSYFDSKWTQLQVGSESNLIFSDKQDFPEVGNPFALYVDGISMYRYDTKTSSYLLMNDSSGEIQWKDIEE